MERVVTGSMLMNDTHVNSSLEDLITNFKSIILNRNLEERQFLIYNGKLKTEDYQDKSIEVKISFVQHFQTEYIILILRETTQ